MKRLMQHGSGNMQVEEFFKRFANTPLSDRDKEIDAGASGKFTLAEIYKQVQELEDYLRPIRMQQKNLIDIAEKALPPE